MSHSTSRRRQSWGTLTPCVMRLFSIFAVLLGLLGTALPSTSGNLAAAAPLAQADTGVKSVSVGGGRGWTPTCVVMNTGALRCWPMTDVPTDLGPVSQVSVGLKHACAVTTAGGLVCWGDNSQKQATVPIDLGPVSQVSAGNANTCALTTTGTVRCWGGAFSGQNHVPTNLGPVSQLSSSINPVEAFEGTTCVVTTAGTGHCWGGIGSDVPADLSPASQVVIVHENGFAYACAVRTTGTVYCWSDGPPFPPVPTDLGLVSQISAGFDSICALTTLGTVRCWGDKRFGMTDPPADLGPVSQISVGVSHACAVTRAGGVRCWGSNGVEQLIEDTTPGNGTGNTATMPSIELPTGLVYSAGGQQYQVNLNANSSTAIGAAPPAGSILGPGNTRLWIEMADTQNNRQPFQILQANPDGNNQQVLLDSSTFYQQFPAYISLYYQYGSNVPPTLIISDDRKRIFFVTCEEGRGESAFCGTFQLDLASRTVSQLKWLGFESSPTWLQADGQRAIVSWDLNCTGSLHRVDVEQKPLSGMPVSAVWLSDKSFVYSRYICKGVWTQEAITPQYDIILAHTDGSDNRVLVPGKVASAMALAPDQQSLAFITSDPGKLQSGEVALWVVNLDGTGLRKIMDLPKDAADLRWYEASVGNGTGIGQASPTPSPISTTGEIAYVQDGNIYLLDLTNRKTTPLVTDGTVGLPGEWRGGIQLTWSPDGRRLAYASNRAGNYDIYTLDVASHKLEQISTDPLDEYLPSFAPDGTLFFVRITKAHVHNNVVGEWELIRATTPGQQTVVTADTYVVDKIDALSHDEIMIITSGDMGWGSLSTGKKDLVWNNNNYNCAWPGGGQSTFDAAWSHDGATLAVIAADCPQGDTSGNWRNAILLVDAANPSAEPQRLLSDQHGFSALDWSPDDVWLVYEGGTNKEVGLWLVSANGGTPQRIAETGTHPAWRPAVTGDSQVQSTVEPTAPARPTAPAQPTAAAASSDTAVSYILSGHVTAVDGTSAKGVIIGGDTCGTTTTDAKGDYVLTWYATEPKPCTVRLYQQNVPAGAWGAVFDPPVYTFTTQGADQKDFVMRSERRPLVVVPGIMGSELYEGGLLGGYRWPAVTDASRGFDGGRLRLDVDPLPDIIATDAVRMPYGLFDTYKGFIDQLQVQGKYVENQQNNPFLFHSTPLQRCNEVSVNTNLFVFAYDWRKSNTKNASQLQEYIDCVRKRTGSEYVDVVAHSMGGLLTRRYVLDYPESHHIDRFISIATPWLGAPKTISVIESGQFSGITDKGVIFASQLKPLVEYYPGAHELLPSAAYFRNSDTLFGYKDSVFSENGWNYNHNAEAYEDYTYQDTMNALNQRFNSNPGTANNDFHTTEQDNLKEWYGVDHYNIYGSVDTDNTVVKVSSELTGLCDVDRFNNRDRKDVEVVCTGRLTYFLLTFSKGDGTVPIISAVPPPLKAPQNCNDQNPHVACFFGNNDQAEHGALVRNGGVITTLTNVLARRTPAPPAVTGSVTGEAPLAYATSFRAMSQQAAVNAAKPAHYITILNTPSATLADALGNTTDALSGTLNTPVPNASYYILGERAHMFVAPADQTYTLTLPVSQTPMSLEVRTGTGDTTSRMVRYSDLSFPLTTTAMLAISPQGIADLRYDSDGNDSFDAVISPTVSVSGDAASDAEPPAVTIAVAQQNGRWLARITADDTGSGIKQVLYSTDDQHYTIYTAPFEVNPNEVPTLYAFADDYLANRSGVVTYTLSRDVPWVLPGYLGIALALLVLIGGAFMVGRLTARRAPRHWIILVVVVVGAALLVLAALVFYPSVFGQPPRSAVSAVAPTPASATTAPLVASPQAALPTRQPTATSVLVPTVTLAAASASPSTAAPSATSARMLPTAQAAQAPALAPTVTFAATPGATARPASTPTAAPRSCSLALVGGFGTIWRNSADLQQRLGCPTQAERGGQIAEQPYERGSMFYYDPLRLIYALAGSAHGTWRVYEQDRLMSQPTPTPATPPPSLIAPVHGFGLVWGTQAWVHNSLGWGTRNEDGPFDGAAQRFEHGTMLFSPVGLGRGKVLYVLYDDGTFDRYDDPNR